MRTLASTVDAVHRQGIIHGNLKPSKVLLAADGTPKITGFIIAEHQRNRLQVYKKVRNYSDFQANL